MSAFGIYVLTYPGDFHLSRALVNSLRHFNPGIPVTIIPGDGFDAGDHPFGEMPIMENPGGFYGKMHHIDKKFWPFAGVYDSFLYLDADMLCLRDITEFAAVFAKGNGPFFAQMPGEFKETGGAPRNDDMRAVVSQRVSCGQLGDVAMLREFDPGYDPFAAYPLNAGMFASRKGVLAESDFAALHDREEEFLSRRGLRFSWSGHELFFADQGRLNYLLAKKGIHVEAFPENAEYCWGGSSHDLSLEDCLAGKSKYGFIHWAGCPRPTGTKLDRGVMFKLYAYGFKPLDYGRGTKRVPLLDVWEHFREGAGAGNAFYRREKRKIPRRIAAYIVKTRLKAVYRAIRAMRSGTKAKR